MRWKQALNAFPIALADRFPVAETCWSTARSTVNVSVPAFDVVE